MFGLGSVVSIFGQLKSARSQLNADRASANLLQLQAESTIVRGRAEASKVFSLFASRAEEARASYASGNVDVTTGTARTAQEQFTTVGKLEAQQIKLNAAQDAAMGVSRANNIRDAADAQYHGNLFNIAGSTLTDVGKTATMIGGFF